MEFNLPAARERLATLAGLMGSDARAVDDAAHQSVELMKAWLAAMDAPRRLPWDDYRGEDLELAIEDVAGRQMALDNARDSTTDDLRAIIEHAIAGW